LRRSLATPFCQAVLKNGPSASDSVEGCISRNREKVVLREPASWSQNGDIHDKDESRRKGVLLDGVGTPGIPLPLTEAARLPSALFVSGLCGDTTGAEPTRDQTFICSIGRTNRRRRRVSLDQPAGLETGIQSYQALPLGRRPSRSPRSGEDRQEALRHSNVCRFPLTSPFPDFMTVLAGETDAGSAGAQPARDSRSGY